MKCAIIGGAFLKYLNEEQIMEMKKFGEWCAGKNICIFTGACAGVPYTIVKGCVEKGGKSIGYSPASDAQMHVKSYSSPLDGCSEMVFLSNASDVSNENFILRSLNMIKECDVVVSFEGNWGTLNELVIAVFYGKTVIVNKQYSGVSEIFEDIYSNMSSKSVYKYNEKFLFVNSIDELKIVLERLSK